MTVIGENVTIHSIEESNPMPLSIHHIPVTTTFALVGEDIVLVDPSLSEESIMTGKVSITMNTQKELCSIQKNGGTPVDMEIIVSCCDIAFSKALELDNLIQTLIKEDFRRRELNRKYKGNIQ